MAVSTSSMSTSTSSTGPRPERWRAAGARAVVSLMWWWRILHVLDSNVASHRYASQAWPASPNLLSNLMIANGLIPIMAFGGTVLYEMRVKGLVCSKAKTLSSAAVVPVAPYELTDATDAAAETPLEAKEELQADGDVPGPASRACQAEQA